MRKKFWITALTFGLPWIIFMIIYNSLIQGTLTLRVIISATVGGLIAGPLFAWAMQYLANKLFKSIVIETEDNEIIIKEGAANHFKVKEGVGGKLVLTDKRLIFKSHKFNVQNHQDTFDLDQVKEVKVTKPFRFLQNGLNLELSNDIQHKFIVDDPIDWVEKIKNQKQQTI